MKKLSERTSAIYRTDVREIADALGIPLNPSQWVTIEYTDGTAPSPALVGLVHVVVSDSRNA